MMNNRGFNQIRFGGSDSTIKLPKTYGSVEEFMDDLRRSSPTYQSLMADMEKMDKEMEEMMKRKR